MFLLPGTSTKVTNFTITTPQGKQLMLEAASFQRRLVANSIDLLIIVISLQFFSFFIYKFYNLIVFSPLDVTALQSALSENLDNRRITNLRSAINFLKAERLWTPYIIDQVFSLFFTSLWIIGFWYKKARTPGKMVLGCRIIDLQNAGNIGGLSLRKSIIRFLMSIVSLIPLGLGFITLFFSSKGQAFHDMAAGTSVVVWKNKA